MKDALNSVALRFSQAAPTYEALADVQRKIASDLIQIVSGCSDYSSILEAGCGTGILTRFLCRQFPQSSLHVVDISPSMIALHQQNFSDKTSIRHHVGDVCTFKTDQKFPLVVSNSALHWINPIGSAFKNLHQCMTPEGILAAAWMVKGTLRELRESRIRAVSHKLPRAVLPKTAECLDSLGREGFSVKFYEEKEYKAYYSSATDLLRALNAMGVTGGSFSQAYSPLTRKELQKLIADYESCYKNDEGRVYVTYRVLFVFAGKR